MDEIVGVIEPTHSESTPYQQYHHIADAKEADVAIDFSNPNLLLPLLDESFELPLVVATTGEKEKITQKLYRSFWQMGVCYGCDISRGYIRNYTVVLY